MQQIRNLDLIRELLLEREGVEDVDLSEYDELLIYYNKYLIIDLGLAVGHYSWGNDNYGQPRLKDADLYYLTAAGQEFLANARNPQAWRDVTGEVASKGLEVSIAVLKNLLAAYLVQQFGLS